jgi:hypothetical protein
MSFDLLEYHKRLFEEDFHDRCDKYPFVQKYINRLENTDERYLTFVYQEGRLRNGGLGDRIGGVLSAVAMAIRFNRTLLLRSENEMHEVFRPYHPTDIHSENPKYKWTDYPSWSNFDYKYTNSDDTEYDLYDCINNTGGKNGHCSMVDGDVSTPHILLRSNRCYLCYYDNQKSTVANQQMRSILGVNETSDLFEVAGCMMRLALWPTEFLWSEIGKELESFQKSLPESILKRGEKRMRRLRELSDIRQRQQGAVNGVPTGAAGGAKGAVGVLHTTNQNPMHINPNKSRSLQRRRRLLPALSPNASAFVAPTEEDKSPLVIQVGVHFRCGDGSYIRGGGGYDHMCVYSEDDQDDPAHPKFPLGNPYQMGLCARRSLTSFVEAAVENSGYGVSFSSHQTIFHSGTSKILSANKTIDTTSTPSAVPLKASDVFQMAVVASDNLMASLQANHTMDIPHTIITPSGCHIEIDPSKQCHLLTVVQWVLLSFSDVFVTQAGMPSSFSKYAGLYGLKVDPFRNGKECDGVVSNFDYSRKPMSNWFC